MSDFSDFVLPVIAAGFCKSDGTFLNNKNCQIIFHGSGGWQINLESPAAAGNYICNVTLMGAVLGVANVIDGTPVVKTIQTNDLSSATLNTNFGFVFYRLFANST